MHSTLPFAGIGSFRHAGNETSILHMLRCVAQDSDATADVDMPVGLRPHSMADMRAFLVLSGFLTELVPLLGPQLFSR